MITDEIRKLVEEAVKEIIAEFFGKSSKSTEPIHDVTITDGNGENKKTLLKLYKIYVDEEHLYFKHYLTSIAFFWGIIYSIFALAIFGVVKATELLHFILLIFPFAVIIMVSVLGIKASTHLYENSLKSITSRAKIEEELGLTKKRKNTSLWSDEPIVYPGFLGERNKFKKSSENFVKAKISVGYHKYLIGLYIIDIAFSLLIIIYLLYLLLTG
jgi:hypothetical protein